MNRNTTFLPDERQSFLQDPLEAANLDAARGLVSAVLVGAALWVIIIAIALQIWN